MLPMLRNEGGNVKKEMVQFRGLNYSDLTRDGDLKDCINLSTRRYPFLTTRKKRVHLPEHDGATAMTVRGELVVLKGTDLYYGGEIVGKLSEGEKQFAVVNTKLCIFPDKKYLDLNTKQVMSLGAFVQGSGAKFVRSTGDMTVSGWGDLTALFKSGDAVTITGCIKEPGNNRTLRVVSVGKNLLHFGEDVLLDATEAGVIQIERRVPELDFICESNNRLYGCSNADRTIYVSAFGDPTNFFVEEGIATDSYAVAVGSEGDFTGCCKYASSVLFWKENKLHKLLGDFPTEYALYDSNIEGLQKGSHKSLQTINDVLYYLGIHGVYAYAGGAPQLLSDNFGEKLFTNGVAGQDGDTYYLSAKEGEETHLLVYETKTGLWMREDATNAIDFARLGVDLYMLDDSGKVWRIDGKANDTDVEWMAHFAPFYETLEGRKQFKKVRVRVELPKGSWIKAAMRYDGGVWQETGKMLGKEADTVTFQLPVRRCDSFEVRLMGKGHCTLKGLMLEYRLGSDA